MKRVSTLRRGRQSDGGMVKHGQVTQQRQAARLVRRVLCGLLLTGPMVAGALADGVTHADFSSTADLQLNGSAITTTTADGDVLQLVPTVSGQAGSFFTTSAFDVRYGFSSAFAFRIHDMGTPFPPTFALGADGMTFTLQAQAPTALGGGGGGLGYGGETPISPSVAVRFDTFQNDPYEASDDYVGLLTNGNLDNGQAHPQQQDLTGTGSTLRDGSLVYAWMDYDGGNLNLYLNSTNAKPGTTVFSGLVNASQLQNAYVGFTASTGAGWANFDIANFNFNTTGSAFTDIHADASSAAPSGTLLNWNDAFNWMEGSVPTVSNNVFLDASANGTLYGVEVTDHQQSQNLDLTAATDTKTALYVHDGGQLDVAGNLTIRSNTSVVVADTSILNVAGTTNWTGGDLGGDFNGDYATGTLNLYGPVLIGGAGEDVRFAASTVNLYNPTTWLGNNIVSIEPLEGGTLNNYSDFLVQCDTYFFWDATQSSIFNNQNGATFAKDFSDGETRIDPIFNNDGTVNINTGTLWLAGGGTSNGVYNVADGTILNFSDYVKRWSDAGAITTTLDANSVVNSAGTVGFQHYLGSSTTDVHGAINAATIIVDANDPSDGDTSLGVVNFHDGAMIGQAVMDFGGNEISPKIIGDLLLKSGTLNIQTGNEVNLNDVYVGANSDTTSSGYQCVVNVNSNTILNSNSASVGHLNGNNGYVFVNGVGSAWNITNDLTLANDSGVYGSVDISGGAGLDVGGNMRVGGGSFGLLNVFADGNNDIATVHSGGDVIVGENAEAWLHVFNHNHDGTGAGLVTTDGSAFLGYNATGAGMVWVEDYADVSGTPTPSQWNIGGMLHVGHDGAGELNIGSVPTDPNPTPRGGEVNVDGGIHLATNGGSTGTINVWGVEATSGLRATLLTNDDLIVGDGGTGTLNIGTDDALITNGGLLYAGGGLVTVAGNMIVGNQDGSNGDVEIKFADPGSSGYYSTLQVNGTLTVGNEGNAHIGLFEYGQMQTGSAVIAKNHSADVSLSAGSSWNVNGDLTLGESYEGWLSVWAGSKVTVTGGMTVDQGSVVEISNGSPVYFPGNSVISVGTTLTVGSAGYATINIGEHAEMVAQQTITIGLLGTVDLKDPTSQLTGAELSNSGWLGGVGIITAGVFNSGTVHPGHSPGVLTISGDYTQTASGILDITLDGTAPGTAYSQLLVAGNVDLQEGNTLNVIPGFTPNLSDTFYILHYSGTLAGNFTNINLPTGYTIDYDVSDPSGGAWVAISNVSVPEPASLTLLGLGTLVLTLRRRRTH